LLSIGPYATADEALRVHESAGAVQVGMTTVSRSETPVLDAAGNAMASDRIIVRFADGVNLTSAKNLAESLGAKVLKNLPIINGAVIEVSDPGSAKGISSAISQWQAQPWVRYAEPDYQMHVTAIPDDPLFSELWGMNNEGQTGGTVDADIDAPEAWDRFTGSSSVVLASIDTGVDYNHEDLAANMWVNPGEIPDDGIDNDGNGYVDDVYGINSIDEYDDPGNPMDDAGHGTHTSGTMAAVGDNDIGVAGVSWNAQIMALKFLDWEGYGWTSDAVECVQYATMMKTEYGVNVVATNNSWGGGGYDQSLYDAIEVGNEAGILFVAAAGNEYNNNDANPSYPGSYDLPGIISVAATDHNDQKPAFSNWGATTVDLGAPGVNITSTVPWGYEGGWDGTSMASPHVTGTVGLIMGRAPTLTIGEVKDLILNNVDPVPALDGITVTGGRLNAANALGALGLVVVGSSPAENAVLGAPINDFVVDFSDAYDPDTVDATDLTVNGIPADDFVQVDPDTLAFHFNTSPMVNQGPQTMAMAEGVLTRLDDGKPLWAWSAGFWYDEVPMGVVSTDPPDGSFVEIPFTTLTVNLNEEVGPASVGTDDLFLSQGQVVAADVAPDGLSVQYTLAGITVEALLTVGMPAGALTDSFGNPSGPYAGSFWLDYGTVAYPTPLEAKAPVGSLVYDPSMSGALFEGDSDNFTIDLDAGQTICVVVMPDANLQPSIEVRDPGGALVGSASSPGQGIDAILQAVAVTEAGTYTVTVSGENNTAGGYTVIVNLNAAVEEEEGGGPSNDTLGTAQDIESSFIDLGRLRPTRGRAGSAAARGDPLGTVGRRSGVGHYRGEPVGVRSADRTRRIGQRLSGSHQRPHRRERLWRQSRRRLRHRVRRTVLPDHRRHRLFGRCRRPPGLLAVVEFRLSLRLRGLHRRRLQRRRQLGERLLERGRRHRQRLDVVQLRHQRRCRLPEHRLCPLGLRRGRRLGRVVHVRLEHRRRAGDRFRSHTRLLQLRASGGPVGDGGAGVRGRRGD